MTDLEQAVLLISGFVHDTDHPGYNNMYLVNTRDILALRYNDKSVLENHHIAIAFDTMLKDPSTCIYDNFSLQDFKTLREDMINLVLATDMANHFKDMGEMSNNLNSMDFDPSGSHKKAIMNWMIHLADISNPTKPWKICYKWIDLLFVEFFQQGDKEREQGLQISYLMDWHTTNIAKAQGGFIDNLIKPAFATLSQILPKVQVNLDHMQHNKEQWVLLEAPYSLENDPLANNKKAEDILDASSSSSDSSDEDLEGKEIDFKGMSTRRKYSIMGKISPLGGLKINK